MNELEQLVAELGARSLEARHGKPGFPDTFDEELWRNLEETGLSRLTATEDAGPAEAAIVLTGSGSHAAAVPIAETDLLAMWLAAKAGVAVPDTGPLTVVLADAEVRDGRVSGNRARCAVAGLCARGARREDRRRACMSMRSPIEPTAVTHNLAGEPRGTFAFEIEATRQARQSGRRRIDSPRRVGTLRADHRRTRRRP